jgi:hypothetical protein
MRLLATPGQDSELSQVALERRWRRKSGVSKKKSCQRPRRKVDMVVLVHLICGQARSEELGSIRSPSNGKLKKKVL